MNRRTVPKIIAGAVAGISGVGAAVAADAKAGPCRTVGKGGVGESGISAIIYHQVAGQTEKVMVLRNVGTSLCGNTGTIGVLVVNGKSVAHGNITKKGSSIQTTAKPEDHVSGIIHTVPLFNEIVCVRLGELNVELDECELVK